jgi:hypothetical protein
MKPRWARSLTPKCLQSSYLSIYLRLSLHQGSPLIADGEHEDSHYDHGEGEELAHGEGSEDKTKLGIRFANEFHDHPTDSIAGDKTPEDGTGWRYGLRDEPQ